MACALAGDREHEVGRRGAAAGVRRRPRLPRRATSAALAAHMQALQDPATRARLGGNARRAVLSFSPSAITLQQVLLYRDLLASPAPGVAIAVDAGDADPRSLPDDRHERNRFHRRRRSGDLRVSRRGARAGRSASAAASSTRLRASGRGSKRTIATTACCGTRRTAPPARRRGCRDRGEQARDRRLQPAPQRRDREDRRGVARAAGRRRRPRPTRGTTRSPPARSSIGCRSSRSRSSTCAPRRRAPTRRTPIARRAAKSSPGSTLQRADLVALPRHAARARRRRARVLARLSPVQDVQRRGAQSVSLRRQALGRTAATRRVATAR